MKNIHSIFLLTAVLLTVTACNKDEENNTDTQLIAGLSYFPVDSGIVRFYDVDSIYCDEFTGLNDTISYELKEVIAANFIDDQGRPAQRIERFKKDSTGTWVIHRVWSMVRTNFRAEVLEENTRFIKTVFPTVAATTWNGNAYNTNGDQTYEITTVDIPASSNGLSFNKTLHVLEENDPANFIYDYQQLEKYADGIGAYYKFKSYIVFDTQPPYLDTISGYVYTEKLNDYILP